MGTIWFQNWRPVDQSWISSLGAINNLFTKYAHLYGNIYALSPSVDRSYAQVYVDSVLFRTRFSNIYNHQFVPYLIYANIDSTLIDSLILYDDGLHGDSLFNDGIYGGYIPKQQTENFYFLSVSTVDNQTSKYFNTPDLCRFTTAGPVVIDSLIVTYNPFPRTYTIKAAVKNESQSVTLENLYINMSTDDSSITYIIGSLSINSLAHGQTIIPSGSFTVRVDTNTFSGEFKFNFNIYSNTLLYWHDSFTYIITEVEENESLPFTYNVEQNYPNPFNPMTNIKFRIADRGFVSLKVFDVLGNEVATLVNEEKPAGTYELTWNAKNLPSGIYFYRLQAGSFIDTKKMILIK